MSSFETPALLFWNRLFNALYLLALKRQQMGGKWTFAREKLGDVVHDISILCGHRARPLNIYEVNENYLEQIERWMARGEGGPSRRRMI